MMSPELTSPPSVEGEAQPALCRRGRRQGEPPRKRRRLLLIKASVVSWCQCDQCEREDTMDRLQVSITCLLLKVTFEPSSAGLLQNPSRCPTCQEGYFVLQNCTVTPNGGVGVRCELCTDCSAAGQDTLVKCSTFADSMCGSNTTSTITPTETPTEVPTVSAPEPWLILSVILVCVFLIFLLSLFLTLRSCPNQQGNKHKGLDLL